MQEGGALMGERVATEKEREKVEKKKNENMHRGLHKKIVPQTH